MRTTLGILSVFAVVMLFISAPSESAQVDRLTALERKVSDLEIQCMVMSGDINQLKFDRMVDEDSIQGFQGSVDDLRHDVEGATTTKIEKLRSDVDELSKRVSSLEDKLQNDSGSSSAGHSATR